MTALVGRAIFHLVIFGAPMEPESGTFGEMLKAALADRGWTQEDLRAAIAATGAKSPSQPLISCWFTNTIPIAHDHLTLVADVLGWGPEVRLTALDLAAKVRAARRGKRADAEVSAEG